MKTYTTTSLIQNENETEKPIKKHLYPTDGFGELENGMVYDSKIYRSGIRENKDEIENFIIHTK